MMKSEMLDPAVFTRKPNWKMNIKGVALSEIWKDGKEHGDQGDGTLTINDFAARLEKELLRHVKTVKRMIGEVESLAYEELVQELTATTFEDFDDFDNWLESFYDFCDAERIWFYPNA